MCKFFWFCACTLALYLPLAFSEINTTIVTTQIAGQKESDLLPKSEKLILYRRQPPSYNGIKGITKRSKQRRRYNSPTASKIKIRPSSHHHHHRYGGDTFGYFKPPLGPSSSSYPGHAEEPPSVPFIDFQHLKLDPHDFRIPSSSYEAQSMDLNFYNDDQDLYGPPKYSAIEYNLDGPPSSNSHVPHQKYGLPTIEQNIGHNSYETPESYISHHHHHHHNHQYHKPPSHSPHFVQPSEHYGVPPPAAPDSGYISSYTPAESPIRPPDRDSYSIYEQKVPNVGYHQNFAEPPKAPQPPQHNSNIHFGHSPPGYEHMSTSYQSNNQQYDQTHQYRLPQQQETHPSEYAEVHPPQPPPPPAPPSHNPIVYTQIENHPVQPPQSYPHEDYAPPSQELPLNLNSKTPGFDYTKSSYEVPIYDAIPFEASNLEEQELYPPIINGKSPNSDTQTLSSSKRRRKRKRGPNNAVVSKKHTLDVPELQQAYDDDSHVRDIDTDPNTDTDAHGSHYVEQKRKFVNYLTPTTRPTSAHTTTSSSWSPMQVRTTASTVFLPTIVTSTPATRSVTRSSIINRGTSRYHITTPSDRIPIKPASTVTIEKSHSQSYYDGTIAPPTYQQFSPLHNGRHNGQTRTRLNNRREPGISLALHPANGDGDDSSKRTTKGVFDTTLFKSPHNNREIQRKLNVLHQSLPKNHKLY